ncbi:MAG: DUF2779 domain-containing protein [bacterium]|nr:DUF2779 domain-containing protein [bacterium]
MNTTKIRESDRNLDKPLVEAGIQCRKRLWLDFHRPAATELSPTRKALSATGARLLELARSAFPMGAAVEEETIAAAAERTRELIAEDKPVLFGATFQADGAEVVCDIVVRHKDGAVDVYEVKSGTKITQRYLNDLALQVHVLEASGLKLRAAFLLHQNSQYVHQEGADYPPMQLLRSADVTAKVQKQVPHVAARLASFRRQCESETPPDQAMGSFCTTPTPCPHFAECSKDGAEHPAYELPELTRQQEHALRADSLTELTAIDPARKGLTFSQRRTIESVKAGEVLIEEFVRDELRQSAFPIHFLALATVTDALPRFTGQRPWRQTPYAFAVNTLHEDGRVESTAMAHADRTDPRAAVMTALGRHVEVGGTIACWDADQIEDLRPLLEDLPDQKGPVRAVISRSLLDLMQLFDAGIFHPKLRGHRDLAATVAALLGDNSGKKLAITCEDDLRALLDKASAPRVRSTTKQKIATQIEDAMNWRSERLMALFCKFADVDARSAKGEDTASKKPSGPAKSLPPPVTED